VPIHTLETLPDLVDAIAPAVVHIEVANAEGRGNGSGFCVESLTPGRATIVTNAHVADGATELVVVLADHSRHPARVRGIDPSTDVAVLEIDVVAPHTLAFRPLREVRVGEPVLALGSPYGYAGTVTTGIVSALDRTMPAPNRMPIDRMVQTDAVIGPGNSGGPLVGLDGRVIGVNDQIRIGLAGAPTGLAFAISSATVTAILEEVRRSPDGVIRRGTIRARLQKVPLAEADRARLGQTTGALLVAEPEAATPSALAGLRQGDVIVALAGETVDEPADVFRLLDSTTIGRDLPLTVVRNGGSVPVTVTPIERTVR
jgi:serine protease Do